MKFSFIDLLVLLAASLLLVLITGCRVPGVDQHENNHKVIQVWPQ